MEACSGREPGAGFLFLRGSGSPDEISLGEDEGEYQRWAWRSRVPHAHGFTTTISRNYGGVRFSARASQAPIPRMHLALTFRQKGVLPSTYVYLCGEANLGAHVVSMQRPLSPLLVAAHCEASSRRTREARRDMA